MLRSNVASQQSSSDPTRNFDENAGMGIERVPGAKGASYNEAVAVSAAGKTVYVYVLPAARRRSQVAHQAPMSDQV